MKKIATLLLSLSLAAALAACGGNAGNTGNTGMADSAALSAGTNAASSTDSTGVAPDPVTDQDISAAETKESFSLTTEDGSFTQSGSVYTISSAGSYTLSGLLEGQILVEAGEDDEIELDLAGTTIVYGEDSPIKILSAGKVEISAKSGTDNVIRDTRGAKTQNRDDQGEGAIYAKCDLKLKGTGTLVVSAGYNNGIHTTKDLTIQKLSLKVSAYNNAVKGNDSVKITSGTVVAISTNGDGIKTENTDANKKGETRGDIVLSGGAVTVYAAGDAFQAAHDFEMITGEEATAPTVTIYTGSYSGYTASGADTSSYKGIKVQNILNIQDGVLTVQSYDDALHADYGTVFEDGTKGEGTITISGGTLTLNVYSPAGKTAGGQMGPGFGGRGGNGWGGQQTVSGADAIHADQLLTISGGTIRIDSAYEGLEANVIEISGGTTYAAANDDGVNACKGQTTPQITVSGGYLEVTVAANGDVDGIDSNGNYTQTGGVVIARGPSNEMSAAIDADGSVKVAGGTLILLGYGRVTTSGSVKAYSLSLHSAGSHSVSVGGTTYSFTNASAYGRTFCYSDVSVTGK